MRPRAVLVTACSVIALQSVTTGGVTKGNAKAADTILDSLVAANAHTLRLRDGSLEGPGAEVLLREAAGAQFLVLGEEHNVVEIPELVTALMAALEPRAGYHYIALEQDPVTMGAASRAPLRGHLDSLAVFARRYPHAYTFVSDQELAMIAAAGADSRGRGDPIWGLDQSFGATYALDRLLAISEGHSSPEARALAARYRDSAAVKERVRDLETFHYMVAAKAEDFARLDSAFAPPPGSEAAFILDNLVRSDRIFRNWREGRLYDNGYEREEQMKRLFIDEYRRAQALDHTVPKSHREDGALARVSGGGPQ